MISLKDTSELEIQIFRSQLYKNSTLIFVLVSFIPFHFRRDESNNYFNDLP